MKVMYRSTLCTFTDHSASGKPYQVDGFQRTDIQPIRQGQSDLYEAKLSIDGGGECQWRLSNVTFGVAYRDPTKFGESVTYGAGGGVVVIFDRNNSGRGGADFEVDGNLSIKKDYYPWVSESFIGGHQMDVSLLSEGYDYDFTYRALQAREVYFEPILHSEFLVNSVGPKEKRKGNYATFTYPDGSVEAVARAKPDFFKLQRIRTGRSHHCFSPTDYSRCPDRRPQLLPDWLPEPDMPGHGRYEVVDEWGNKLGAYFYRLVGSNGQVFQGKSDLQGHTAPVPDTALPLRKVEFPESYGW